MENISLAIDGEGLNLPLEFSLSGPGEIGLLCSIAVINVQFTARHWRFLMFIEKKRGMVTKYAFLVDIYDLLAKLIEEKCLI